MEPEARHQCFIYKGSPSHKLGIVAAILRRKLNEGYRCLYLNSPPMVAGMASTLAAMGIELESEISKGSLILSSEPVSSSMGFNSEEMLQKLENSLDQAISDGYKGLWASGDMTWEFGPERDFSKLMEYELGLEDIFRRRKELCGVCQYHHETLPQEAMRQGLLTHSNIVINETLSVVNPHYLKTALPIDTDMIHKLDHTISALYEQQDML